MTFKIDNEALKRAIMRHYEQQMGEEIREFFAMHAPKELNHIWQLYMEEVKQAEEDRKHQVRDFWHSFMIIVGISITGYAAYRLWTL